MSLGATVVHLADAAMTLRETNEPSRNPRARRPRLTIDTLKGTRPGNTQLKSNSWKNRNTATSMCWIGIPADVWTKRNGRTVAV